jgi:hypothetical protein
MNASVGDEMMIGALHFLCGRRCASDGQFLIALAAIGGENWTTQLLCPIQGYPCFPYRSRSTYVDEVGLRHEDMLEFSMKIRNLIEPLLFCHAHKII